MTSSALPARTRSAPRGNTIVLVTAILVLLVIIATAFVSRTRAVRQTSAAQLQSSGRDGRAESIAVNVAQEVADALFAKPIDTNDPFARVDATVNPPVAVGSSSWPRLPSPLGAWRYSIDRDVLPAAEPGNPVAGDGYPDFGYNFAPYEVRAWTNWPDFFGGPNNWPAGPGSPDGRLTDAAGRALGDGNPYGNPGMGDSRWLRSTEPERVGFDQTGDGIPDLFNFSHWSHLSWLPTANNGWRVVTDISDLENFALVNLNENELNFPLATAVPYEQWLPGVTPIMNPAQVIQPATVEGSFLWRRNNWFGSITGANNYSTLYSNPQRALPNFFDLGGLGQPADEFRPNTARNIVSRTFTDADGDGFTDSFWFLAPVSVERAVRTVVGVSIIDNSGLLNANVATKFSFSRTLGHTPSDLALVTSWEEIAPNQNNGSTVGFLDGPINQPATNPAGIGYSDANRSPLPSYWTGVPQISFPSATPRYDRSRYGDPTLVLTQPQPPAFLKPLTQLQAIGMLTPTGFPDPGLPAVGLDLVDESLPEGTDGLPKGAFESASERLAWFKFMSEDTEQPRSSLTPFDATDEFELRAYHGNNYPGVLSRFEQALSLYSPATQNDDAPNFQFLRATPQREESTEYLDQIDSRQLLVDNRRKLTMFNGARNETMPPWLWVTPYYEESVNYLNPRGTVPAPSNPDYQAFQDVNRAEWQRQQLKVDLRRPVWVTNDGQPATTRNEFAAFQWRRDLTRVLEKTLTSSYTATDSAGNPTTTYASYLDAPGVDTQRAYQRTRSMIASYVANIECATDEAIAQRQVLGALGPVYYSEDEPLEILPPIEDPLGYFPAETRAVVDPNTPARFYPGMEKQPFIMEVFFGIVYPKSDFDEEQWNGLIAQAGGQGTVPATETLPEGNLGVRFGAGQNFVDAPLPPDDPNDPPPYQPGREPRPVIAVQIANPYDTPIHLRDYRLRFFGKEFNFATQVGTWGPNQQVRRFPILPPATLARPSTAIVYFAPESLGDLTQFRARFLDFIDVEKGEVASAGGELQQLDIDGDGIPEFTGPWDSGRGSPADPTDGEDRTLVYYASSWNEDLQVPGSSNYGGRFRASGDPPVSLQSVELVRIVGDPSTRQVPVVVDRFDNESPGAENSFADLIQRLFDGQEYLPPQRLYEYEPGPGGRRFVDGIILGDNDFYMTWCRASRAWAFDVDGWQSGDFNAQRITATELSPRYIFSKTTPASLPSRRIPFVRLGQQREGDDGVLGDVFDVNTDPDLTAVESQTTGQWPRGVFHDCFNRQLFTKPVFFTNILAVRQGNADPRPSAVYQIDGNPIPFVGDGVNQRGVVSINGQNYNWVTGSKGMPLIPAQAGSTNGASAWEQFAAEEYMTIPYQMTQKDSDFEQIGEILDVPLWGHVCEDWANPKTIRTFSEILVEDDPDSEFYPGSGPLLNRLWIRPPGETGQDDPGTAVLGARLDPTDTAPPISARPDYVPWRPALPMGVGLFDALTVDGPGRNPFDRNLSNGIEAGTELSDATLAEERTLALAGRYRGIKTPGLVNINTAIPEVMQALPLLTRTNKSAGGSAPYSRFVDMIRSYRDRTLLGAPTPFPTNLLPTYADRGLLDLQVTGSQIGATLPADLPRFFPGMRTDRGFASIGELALINRLPDDTVPAGLAGSYSWRWLGFDPWADYASGSFADYAKGYSWSTDRTYPRARQLPDDIASLPFVTPDTDGPEFEPLIKDPDRPLGDAEDLNQLLKGISNLVTTRSDVFTIYLRIRQVKQNPVTGVFDGTKPDAILDDARYVMCIDRSNVNTPLDQPKILYFQRVP